MSRQIQSYGWIPDLPDQRDYLYSAPINVLKALPANVDLRPECPPVYDQEQLGSCTANAIAGAIEFDQIKQGIASFEPSRLFIYYNERLMEGTVNSDSGAQNRDGIKSVATQGVCPDSDWPYDPNYLTMFTVKPPLQCYQDALACRILLYQRIAPIIGQLKGCLASGYPFIFGFWVYESFYSATVAQTGIVPMPQSGEQILGGHTVVAVGYDDTNQWFIVRNSWGVSWGDQGYCYIPYAYLTNTQLAADFWTIRLVS